MWPEGQVASGNPRCKLEPEQTPEGSSVKCCGGRGTLGTGCGFEIGGFFSDLFFFCLGERIFICCPVVFFLFLFFINFGGI